jgi:pyruvate dehydrogenase E2 component (dihydrolipoamide acetyltransferase)
MPIRIFMPALSPTMTDGKLAKWNKKEGDVVKSGDVIAEIETDKATMEYEATDDGVIAKIIVPEGTEGVKVNDTIAILMEKGDTQADVDAFIVKNTGGSAVAAAPATKEAPKEAQKEEAKPAQVVASTAPAPQTLGGKKVFISPLAKRIAEQNNVNYSTLAGSGPNGRIIKHDIELAMSSPAVANKAPAASASLNTESAYVDVPNSGMRKTIAKRLLESKQTIPHYYLTVDCLMDDLLKAREMLNKMGEDKYKLSVNDFIIKAVALAMQKVPDINAIWLDNVTRKFTNSDVAVAVAIDGGLITPIVRSAEKKGLIEISAEMKSLVKKAKEGKLSPSEYQGGSFAISNLGMFGIKEFCAIVNPPHSGILAIGTTESRPVVKNGQIVVGQVMSVTISADHRVVDGAVAAGFLTEFKKLIENPVSMVL